MARPAASPEQRSEQRSRLRGAAAAIYAEKGMQGISARAIAVRAGVSTGTLYSYFANLQELMRSLWQAPVAKVETELEAIAAQHSEPVDRIRALLEKFADFAHANPEVYRGAFLFVRAKKLPESEVQPLHQFAFYRLLCDALREGQLGGSIVTGDVEEMSQLLWAGLHGALGLPINAEAYAFRTSKELAPAMIRGLMRSIEV